METPPFSNKKYQVIYADPPWSYKSKEPTTAKRPSAMGVSLTPDYYYDTMSLNDIKNLPVAEISAKDSVLFLWATNPLIREAFEVMEAWGFKYITMITWHKTNSKGMGYWFRGYTEHLLFGKKGNVKSFRTKIHNLQEHKCIRHSQKPDLFRQLIDDATPHLKPKIELFARQSFQGWDCWGNEVSNAPTQTLLTQSPEGERLTRGFQASSDAQIPAGTSESPIIVKPNGGIYSD